MNLAFRRYVEQIRRRWWVVAIVLAIAVGAAVLSSIPTQEKYTAKATLVVSSPQRAPEQDAKVVLGYANVFNDPGTIDRLKAAKNLPQDVTFEAKTVADSPMLAIEATGNDASVTQEAATRMAKAFRDEVNAAQRAASVDAIDDLQSQLNDVLQRFPSVPGDHPTEIETTLRERINTLKFDETNQLRDLQLTGGVTPMGSNLRMNVALGAAAGLLLGVLAALGLAAVSTRVGNSAELFEKTGIDPLVEVPGGGTRKGSAVRDNRLRTLANMLGTQISARPTVVALTDSRGVSGARDVAENLAKVLAQQEYRTVLIHADTAPQPDDEASFEDVLRDGGLVHVLLQDSTLEKLKLLTRATFFANHHSHMSRARIASVLDELRNRADAMVIAAPSVASTADAQLVCAAADVTIVVVDARSSRAQDVSSTVDLLEKSGAVVLGAVLVNGSKRQPSGSTTATRPQPRQPSATTAQRSRHADTAVPDLRR